MGTMEPRRTNRVAAALLVGGVLLVGTVGTGVALADAEGFGSAPDGGGSTEASAADGASLAPEQMLHQAQGTLERMGKGEDTIRRQLRGARESRDVVKSLCLDDKLTQMDVARRTATDRVAGLEVAVRAGDAERVRHEHAVMMALRDRAESLTAEAEQCIGEEIAAMGNARLEVIVDPDIADADPAIPTDSLLSVPPVFASPTL